MATGAAPPSRELRQLSAVVIVAVIVGVGILGWAVAPTPFGLGMFGSKSAPSSWGSGAAVECSASPCTESISVTADSILFMGFGYNVAQAVAGTMSIHGYPFSTADEYTIQNFGVPSVQAGFYYWVINATAMVTVYLNYSTPAVAEVSLEDFTNMRVTSLPTISAMGDGNGVSVAATTMDVCALGVTYQVDETVVVVTMTGLYQTKPPIPGNSLIGASILPAEVSTPNGSLVGEYGVLTSLGPTVVRATLASSSPFATVCLGLIQS